MAKKFIEKDYNIIKKLLDNKLSKKEVIDVTGWKDTTVRNVEMADTWQDYCTEKVERYKRTKTKPTKPVIEDITEQPANDEKFIVAIAELTHAIHCLVDVLKVDTPIQKEVKEYKLFGRKR